MGNVRLFWFIILLFCNKVHGQEVVPALEILANYPNVRDFALSASGNEAYITLQSPMGEVSVIACIKKEKDIWSEPELMNFAGKYNDLEPFLAPGGLRLYFASNRPLADTTGSPKDFDIWYVERENINSEWSVPINIGAPVNTIHNEFYPSVAANHNLYFTSDMPGNKGKDDILYTAWKNNQYTTPISLSESINTEGYEFNAFVAPDESFLLFSGYNRKDGFGSGDLYISYQNKDKTWSAAKNLGNAINSKSMDYCPFVDLASQTLYFTSKRSSVKNRGFKSIEDFYSEITRYENGYSRIYKALNFSF